MILVYNTDYSYLFVRFFPKSTTKICPKAASQILLGLLGKAILLLAQNCGILSEIAQAFYVLVRNTQDSVTPSRTIPQNGAKVYSWQMTPEN